MENEVRLIDAAPLIADGWVLERHGISNCLIGIKSLADVPTIDPENLRPKGRWEYHDCVCTGDGLTSVYACSECHGAIDEEAFDNLYSTHFCPNCGAKMEG